MVMAPVGVRVLTVIGCVKALVPINVWLASSKATLAVNRASASVPLVTKLAFKLVKFPPLSVGRYPNAFNWTN